VSQSTFTGPEVARVAAVAKAAARYETRAIPILMQLPATPDVLKALSDALPPIYPTARPAIDPSLLERMWRYSLRASEAGAPRDELQSRLARLMVLHDLWRAATGAVNWPGRVAAFRSVPSSTMSSRHAALRCAPRRCKTWPGAMSTKPSPEASLLPRPDASKRCCSSPFS
jgi:hypothetical protein